MNRRYVAERTAPFAFPLPCALAQADTLCFQQGFIEGGEVQAFAAVLLAAHVTAAAYEVGLGDIAKLLDFGEEFRTGECHEKAVILHEHTEW